MKTAVRILVLNGAHVEQIRLEARAIYPSECCGLMIGRDKDEHRFIDRLIPVANVAPADQRHKRFSIDPLTLMKIERALDDCGEKMVGIYHSHPDHPARPSETDLAAAWPFYSYVIVDVTRDGVGQINSWIFDTESGRYKEQKIIRPST